MGQIEILRRGGMLNLPFGSKGGIEPTHRAGEGIGRRQVTGVDVKNTAVIPGWKKQNWQLRQIFNAIPNRYHPTTNPTGNRMLLLYRPGARLPGSGHEFAPRIASGELRLVAIRQYVFAPPDTAGQLK